MKIKLVSIVVFTLLISSCAGSVKPLSVALTNEELENEIVVTPEVVSQVEETQPEEVQPPPLRINGVSHADQKNIKDRVVYYIEGAEELNLENNYFDIPIIYNDQVKKWVNYFTTRGRKFFELYTERAGRYAPIIGTILEDQGLPRDLIFLAMAESGFNNNAKSVAAAVGPWQFMPRTGRAYNLHQDWFIDERRDPIKATIAAAKYLSKLYNDFGAWEIATAAYNAGEGKLGRAIKRYRTTNFWRLSKGKYLKPETKNYVPKIMALAIIGKNLKTFGFHEIEFHDPLDYDEIRVEPLTDINKLSDALNLNVKEIKKLNPELLRHYTPPHQKGYVLRVPPHFGKKFALCCKDHSLKVTNLQKYKIKSKRANLKDVARKFNLRSAQVLVQLNNTSEKKILKRGDILLLPFLTSDKAHYKNKKYASLFSRPVKKKRYKYHLVRRGETLSVIARKHRTSIKRILASNSSIKKANFLTAGKKLVIR